jgi:ribosomal protein S18 acetylase RimI-like enzyme
MSNINISDVYCAIKKVSQNKIWTNIYSLNPLETVKKLESKKSSIFLKKNALVIVEHTRQLKKTHFFMEACEDSMEIFNDIELTSLNLELIEDRRNKKFIESLSTYGFRAYGTLNRMTLKNRDKIKTQATTKVEYANLGDINALSNLYKEYFDCAIDRIPDIFEIEGLVNNRLIICFKDVGDISAFASITLSPGISTLNHLFVKPEFRGRGIGDYLFKSFLSLTSESRTARLWVMPNNIPAISMYQKYNFQFDGLKNLIYKK